MKKLIVLLLISLPLYSQVPKVSNGQAITAEQMNTIIDQLIPIGTVYHSLLTPAQFTALNGDCWKIMDSSSSLVGTDLGALTAKTTLPPAVTNGAFLRQITGARELGSYQEDDNKQHTHTQNSHNHEGVNTHPSHIEPFGFGNYRNGTRYSGANQGAMPATMTSTATPIIHESGGVEARPKNIGVNLFVKVNKSCNL